MAYTVIHDFNSFCAHPVLGELSWMTWIHFFNYRASDDEMARMVSTIEEAATPLKETEDPVRSMVGFLHTHEKATYEQILSVASGMKISNEALAVSVAIFAHKVHHHPENILLKCFNVISQIGGLHTLDLSQYHYNPWCYYSAFEQVIEKRGAIYASMAPLYFQLFNFGYQGNAYTFDDGSHYVTALLKTAIIANNVLAFSEILSQFTAEKQVALLSDNYYTLFQTAAMEANNELFLMRLIDIAPEGLEIANGNAPGFSQSPFIQHWLHTQIQLWKEQAGTHEGKFDLVDENQAVMAYGMARILISTKQVESNESLRFLTTIPSVAKMMNTGKIINKPIIESRWGMTTDLIEDGSIKNTCQLVNKLTKFRDNDSEKKDDNRHFFIVFFGGQDSIRSRTERIQAVDTLIHAIQQGTLDRETLPLAAQSGKLSAILQKYFETIEPSESKAASAVWL